MTPAISSSAAKCVTNHDTASRRTATSLLLISIIACSLNVNGTP
jgi:hypothetical protein